MTSLCIVTFRRSFIDLKSSENITLYLGMYVKHSVYTCKCSFSYYMLQNKQFNRYSLYSMMSGVVLFAHAIKLTTN